jgi:hypothetical protein
MFRTSSVPIIRSYQLYTWQLVCFVQVITCTKLPRVQLIIPDDGHRRCPKHVEFRDKITFWILDASCWLFIRRLALTFRRTLKHETELNLVALKMEEESFFETSKEDDCPTS